MHGRRWDRLPIWRGRIAQKNICSEKGKRIRIVLGTGVIEIAGSECRGVPGFPKEAARAAGFDPVSVVFVLDDKAHYYPGAGSFIVKMVADRKTGKFLGIQCLGKGAVDKMVDIAVMALSVKASIQDLEHLDFAICSAVFDCDPSVLCTVRMLLNKMSGEF